jgi:hypothetical protein
MRVETLAVYPQSARDLKGGVVGNLSIAILAIDA